MASCWDCDDFYIGKTRRRLHDRKTENFRALTKNCHSSAIADHIISTGHNIKWDHFEILATGHSDVHCKINETLLIKDLKPALNKNVVARNFFSISLLYIFQQTLDRSVYYHFFVILSLITRLQSFSL